MIKHQRTAAQQLEIANDTIEKQACRIAALEAQNMRLRTRLVLYGERID